MNTHYYVCWALVIGSGALSLLLLLPGQLWSRVGSLSLVALLATYMGYEVTMPREMNIRVDLLILWPLLGLNVVLFCVRVILHLNRVSTGR